MQLSALALSLVPNEPRFLFSPLKPYLFLIYFRYSLGSLIARCRARAILLQLSRQLMFIFRRPRIWHVVAPVHCDPVLASHFGGVTGLDRLAVAARRMIRQMQRRTRRKAGAVSSDLRTNRHLSRDQQCRLWTFFAATHWPSHAADRKSGMTFTARPPQRVQTKRRCAIDGNCTSSASLSAANVKGFEC